MKTENEMQNLKSIHGFQYFTGAHPKIRSHCRAKTRPTEFGNKVWATSLVLLDHIHQGLVDIKGLRVLEIGCGWGLLGVYLAKTQDCEVTCSDLDPNVLPIVDMLAELNGVSVVTRKASFDELGEDLLKNYDLIIGAEVCYSSETATELIQMMKRAFSSGVERVLIGDPGRPDFEENLIRCREFCDFQTLALPGTVNGKVTTLLSAHRRKKVTSSSSFKITSSGNTPLGKSSGLT